jgi:hypothetical protein
MPQAYRPRGDPAQAAGRGTHACRLCAVKRVLLLIALVAVGIKNSRPSSPARAPRSLTTYPEVPRKPAS